MFLYWLKLPFHFLSASYSNLYSIDIILFLLAAEDDYGLASCLYTYVS